MANAFNFELVSPEKLMLSEAVTEVVVPGSEGYMTVMANHSPVMTSIQPGVIEVKREGETTADKYVVFGGFLEVSPANCTLLAESVVAVGDINAADLDQRISNANDDLNDAADDEARSKAKAYLDQLTTLKGAILSA